MSFLSNAFLFPLLLIGVIASYYDIRKGIIPNKLVFIGYFWTVLLLASLSFYNIFFVSSVDLFNHIGKIFLNGTLSVIVGYVIWLMGFWSAGDGKLFGLYGFLLPLEFYSEFYVLYFPSSVLLVNFFVPLILLISLRAIIDCLKRKKSIKKRMRESIFLDVQRRKKFKKNFLQLTIDIATAMVVIALLINFLRKIPINLPMGFFVLFLLLAVMHLFKLLKKRFLYFEVVKYVIIGLFLINTIFYQGAMSGILFVRNVIVFSIVIGFFRQALILYVKRREIKRIKVKNLEEGMILTKEWESYFIENISKLTKNKKHEHFQRLSPGGLTKDQVKIIKDLFKENEKYEVEICNTFPFAPFMLLAVTISIITSSTFILSISYLIDFLIHF